MLLSDASNYLFFVRRLYDVAAADTRVVWINNTVNIIIIIVIK